MDIFQRFADNLWPKQLIIVASAQVQLAHKLHFTSEFGSLNRSNLEVRKPVLAGLANDSNTSC